MQGLRSEQPAQRAESHFKPVTENHEDGLLIDTIFTNVDNDIMYRELWPEMIRVLLLFPDERLDFDPESYSDEIQELLKKVGSLQPSDYNW